MPTPNQAAYYMAMRCSSEFNADEVKEWDDLLHAAPPPSHEQTNDLLGTMQRRLDAKTKREQAALTRKAEYREWANKRKG